jgi:hypothetical protein
LYLATWGEPVDVAAIFVELVTPVLTDLILVSRLQHLRDISAISSFEGLSYLDTMEQISLDGGNPSLDVAWDVR